MRIASIDPGVTTGLAIANVHDQPRIVSLEPFIIRDVMSAAEVVRIVTRARCRSIVMERRPSNASQEGTETYEAIFNRLIMAGYKDTHHFKFQDNSLSLITPGLWKPVMKAQKIMDYGTWLATSPHMKDALGLLHYSVKLNFMSKDIMYE